MRHRLLTLTAVLGMTITSIALAQQDAIVTVNDTAGLQRAMRAAKAGQTIRIKPGTYRGGLSASGLRGEKKRPIVIEGAEGQEKTVIEGGQAGLQLSDCQHVTLRHIVFRGATGNGINIDDGGDMDASAVGIVIEKVHVEDVGPKGNTDGIKLSGVRDFTVRDCVVAGWGGNAIDLVGCADGEIVGCTVQGKAGFDCTTGPQLKGGTRDVFIRGCVFDNAGLRAINVGGSTGLQFFRPPDAAFEAKDITVEGNIFRGSETPVAFVGVDGAMFQNNTIFQPRKWVLRILQESKDARFARCRNVVFRRNLIVYEKKAVRTAVNIGPDTEPATFAFRENWWWCVDNPADRPQLPSPETGGIYGQDPKLDLSGERFDAFPNNPAAREYGLPWSN